MENVDYRLHSLICKTSDITLFTLLPESKNKIVYQAGQYVEAALPNNHWIPLSIANAPRTDGLLTFQIRHNKAHPLATTLLDELERKKNLTLRGPFGHCTLKRAFSSTKLLFLAGGTGFAPLNALLEEALENPVTRELHLFWGISHPLDAYAEENLLSWQKAVPQFKFEIVLSNPKFYPDWTGKTGWVHEELARSYPNLEEYGVFVSGPYRMVERAFTHFTQQGLKKEHFYSDL